jgi:hypothetical protein
MKWSVRFIVLGFVVLVVVVSVARTRRAELRANRVTNELVNERLEAVVKYEKFGAVLGQLVSERALVKSLTEKQRALLKAAQKADPGAKAGATAKTTIALEDTTVGHVTQSGGQTECVDEYHRFTGIILSTGECSIKRKQLFSLQQLFIRSTDGKVRIAQSDFKEFDPVTKVVIPSTGIDLKTEYKFADEARPKPPIFKIRPLAGVDHRTAIAAGAELLNLERTEKPVLERLSLGGMGYWKSGTDPRIAARAGYRLVGNVSIGGYYGWEIPKLAPVIGADVTVRLGN